MAIKPTCLHIPELTETQPATITWCATTSDGYELDCVYDRTFDEAGPYGLSWNNIETTDHSWNEFQNEDLSWSGFDILPGSYTIYRGPGVPAGDRRYNWREINAPRKPWRDLRDQRPTWYVLERRFLTYETVVPQGKTFAYFRIRSYSEENGQIVYSDYLESPRIPIASLGDKKDALLLKTHTDAVCEAQVSYANLKSEFEIATMTLSYDDTHLRFLEALIVEEGAIPTDRIPTLQLKVDDPEEGTISFSCHRVDPEDYRSGFVVLFRFYSLMPGETQITLS